MAGHPCQRTTRGPNITARRSAGEDGGSPGVLGDSGPPWVRWLLMRAVWCGGCSSSTQHLRSSAQSTGAPVGCGCLNLSPAAVSAPCSSHSHQAGAVCGQQLQASAGPPAALAAAHLSLSDRRAQRSAPALAAPGQSRGASTEGATCSCGTSRAPAASCPGVRGSHLQAELQLLFRSHQQLASGAGALLRPPPLGLHAAVSGNAMLEMQQLLSAAPVPEGQGLQ